jgi:hypothetical protein
VDVETDVVVDVTVVEDTEVVVEVEVVVNVVLLVTVVVKFWVTVTVVFWIVVVFIGGCPELAAKVTVACAVALLNESVTVIVYVPNGVFVEFVDGHARTVTLYIPAASVLPCSIAYMLVLGLSTFTVIAELGDAVPVTTSLSLGTYVVLSGTTVRVAASASGLNNTIPITNKTRVSANLIRITFLLSLPYSYCY